MYIYIYICTSIYIYIYTSFVFCIACARIRTVMDRFAHALPGFHATTFPRIDASPLSLFNVCPPMSIGALNAVPTYTYSRLNNSVKSAVIWPKSLHASPQLI